MRPLFKFALLGASQRKLLLQAFFLLLLFRVALWTQPFPRVQRLLNWLCARRRAPRQFSPAQISRAVTAMSRFVPRSTCLVQALSAHRLLRHNGWNSQLHVGVLKNGAALLAHAWVECEGQAVIGDTGLARYTPILQLGGEL